MLNVLTQKMRILKIYGQLYSKTLKKCIITLNQLHILYQLDKETQTLHAILRSTVQCMIEWADTQVLRPVSRAILVCFGAFWKQPKKQRWMPARAAASRRTAHNTEPRSLIFLLQPHWTFARLNAADVFETQPTPPTSPLPSSYLKFYIHTS